MNVYVCICMCMCMYMYVYVYVCVCVCVYVCMSVCLYVCMYVLIIYIYNPSKSGRVYQKQLVFFEKGHLNLTVSCSCNGSHN